MKVSRYELKCCKFRFEYRDMILTYKILKELESEALIGGGFVEDEELKEKELDICRNKIEMYKKRFNISDSILGQIALREP